MILDQNRKESTEHAPFVSFPSPERTPDRLWWWGRVRGLDCVLSEHARVLDVGCSSGDLLLSIAELYPGGDFVGVDPDGDAIRRAKEFQEQSGVRNVHFLCGRIEDEALRLGKFDYIICHGVYTWIPPHEQEEFLASLEKCLAPNGILYLSHNTLPGWGARESLVELLRVNAREWPSESDKVAGARDLLRHLQTVLIDAHRPYGMRLREEIERNLERSDIFFLKELLAEDAHGLWLSKVLEEAARSRLRYLCDAHPARNQWMNPDPVFRTELFSDPAHFKGLTENERACAVDILYPASFRGSLFTHESSLLQGVGDDGVAVSGLLQGAFVASPLVCDEEARFNFENGDISAHMVPFYGPSDQVVEVKAPALKHTLHRLARVWPAALSFDELVSTLISEQLLSDRELEHFERTMVGLIFRNLLDVYPSPSQIESMEVERPYVPNYRRARAAHGWTLTLRFELFKTDDLDRVLLPFLNGRTSLDECVHQVQNEVAAGRLKMVIDGEAHNPASGDGSGGACSLPIELTEVVRERIAWYREQGLFALKG